jgi:hypothetical protein
MGDLGGFMREYEKHLFGRNFYIFAPDLIARTFDE